MTKVLVITIKELEPVTSCVRDQDATTGPARHMWETGSLNWSQFMLQWFFRFHHFSESSAHLRKTRIIPPLTAGRKPNFSLIRRSYPCCTILVLKRKISNSKKLIQQSGLLKVLPLSHSHLVVKARLHVPSPSPCPSPCPSSFYIMPMETGRLMGRMGSVPILQDDGPFPLA